MVGWFDPRPLFTTALDVIVSTLFGRHSDYRLLEALVTAAVEFVDLMEGLDFTNFKVSIKSTNVVIETADGRTS